MTQRFNGFEGQTLAATVTPANSAASGDALDAVSANGTIVYDSVALHGTRSVKITPVASSPSGLTYGTSGSPVGGTSWGCRCNIRMDAMPTEAVPLMAVTSDGSTRLTSLGINQNGAFQSRDTATVLSTSASNLFPLSTWLTIELWATLSATAAEFHTRAYTGDSPISANTIYSFDTSAANTGSVSPRTIVFGKFLSTAWATAFNLDDLAIDNAAAGFIGPAAAFVKATLTGSPVHVPRSDGTGGETFNIALSLGNTTGTYLYAIVIEKSAVADFSSGVTTVVDTRSSYQASPNFTYAPPVGAVGYYRFTPYAQQQ